MRLYHTTCRKNVPGILQRGILVNKSTALPRVWLHTQDRSQWAVGHLAKHHQWKREDMVRLVVDLPLSTQKELIVFRAGVYYLNGSIPPSCVHAAPARLSIRLPRALCRRARAKCRRVGITFPDKCREILAAWIAEGS